MTDKERKKNIEEIERQWVAVNFLKKWKKDQRMLEKMNYGLGEDRKEKKRFKTREINWKRRMK